MLVKKILSFATLFPGVRYYSNFSFFSLSLRVHSKSVWSIMFVQTNREVKMAGYIGQILLGVFMDRDKVEDDKNAKKRIRPISICLGQ